MLILAVLMITLAGLGFGVARYGSRFIDVVGGNRATGTSADQRMVYYKDALKIVKDYPVLGTGGRGWNAIYRQYQDFGYRSTEVHSHYLQLWVETGTIGLAAFLAVWAAAVFTTISMLRSRLTVIEKLAVWSVFCAALVLGVHSTIDFNMSLPAIAVLLWGLFGCLGALYRLMNPGESKFSLQIPGSKRVWKPALTIMMIAFVAVSFGMLISTQNGEAGKQLLSQRSFKAAENELKQAVSINPLASNYMAALAEAVINQGSNNPKIQQTALGYIDKAILLEPTNPDYRLIHSRFLMTVYNMDEAVKEIEKASSLSPFDQKYVDYLAQAYYVAGSYYYSKGDKNKGRVYLSKAVTLPDLISRRIANIDPKYRSLQLPELTLTVNDNLTGTKAKALQLLAKY